MRWVKFSERRPSFMEENKGSETELEQVIVRFKGEYSGYRCEMVAVEDLEDYTGLDYEWLEGAFGSEAKQ
jgi:hypothetical protein